MAQTRTDLPVPSDIVQAQDVLSQYLHCTPLLTSQTLNYIASSPDPRQHVSPSEFTNRDPSRSPPNLRLYFKCENFQRTGAFKARGAFFAVSRLVDKHGLDELRRITITTVSSGNHAQGLALAAATFGVPATIVMPTSSTESKIKGVASYLGIEKLSQSGGEGAKGRIVFCGSSNEEKRSAVEDVVRSCGSIFVPPYEHPDIIIGQGTCAKELEEQFVESSGAEAERSLDAVVAPLGGGGLLGGIATWFSNKPGTKVFGAEPSFGGADDGVRGLKQGKRVTSVSSATIADGLRTPVGALNWEIVSDPRKVEGVYAVGEEDIKLAMSLLFERLKVVAEPSACVPLAVVLFNQEFREMVASRQKEAGVDAWDVAIVLSGGNTTVAAVSGLF